jgi:adenylate cyclase
MGREIERKYLLRPGAWTAPPTGGVTCVQGYVPGCTTGVVRVRIMGDQAFLTLKASFTAVTRAEYEYTIPPEDAREMLELLCPGHKIEKTRYSLAHADKEWVVDVFHGQNQGLVLAEIELTSEDEAVERPAWIDREVTSDARYHNSNLACHPFFEW